ncbi:MAG: putative Restriction modification system, type similar to hsdS [Neobacillus sp.]|nr:putative Restriction modification system, type similar to hsdS [Neobacillus sp.]
MKMQTKKIGEIFKASGQERAGTESFPVMSITMHYGLIDQTDKFKKRIASINTSNYKIVYKNELVVGFPIDEGVIGFQTKYKQAIVSPAYNIWKLKDGISCNIDFIGRYLRSNTARRIYASKMRGAVARRRSITKDDFVSIQIPFPPLDDQIRIATILTLAEKLIAKRKESIKALDELLKSTFIEMFGDPVRNEKRWEIVLIDNIVTCINSGTSYGGVEKKGLDNDELGVLKISAVTQGVFNPNEYKAVKKDAMNKEIISLKKGMFLFSRANTKELVAASCIVDLDYPSLFLPDKLWVLTIDKSINPNYLNFLFKNENYRNVLRKKATGGHDSMLNISMQKFRALEIPRPSLSLQKQFATIVEKVESLKTKYTQSLIELENFYGSLSQRAFKGELDLSKVPVDIAEPVV